MRDPRGGGRSSARLTAPVVGAGGDRQEVAARAATARRSRLHERSSATSRSRSRAGSTCAQQPVLRRQRERPIAPHRGLRWTSCARPATRCGARIDVVARNVPVGLGEPLYDKLDADIAYAMMGINAVKGVEIGAGFAVGRAERHEHGDELTPRRLRRQQRRRRARRHLDRAGHHRLDRDQADQRRSARRAARSTTTASRRWSRRFGRHDPCVGIRATPIAEAMLALVLMDHALRHRAQCGDVRVMQPPIPAQAP